MKIFGDVESHVEPDKIRQLQWAHRMVVAKLHSRVDILHTGHSLFKHPHRFKTKRNAQSTRSKTRNVFHDDRFLAHLTANIRDCLYSFSACLLTDNDFKKTHDVQRI